MTTTFLHEDKSVPPDETDDVPAPLCKSCGIEMWLTVVDKTISDAGIDGIYRYECKTCGATAKREVHEAAA
ncbi:MAG: hypothetical protein JO237_08255 [Pseudolabrys sp.]|nr:hypothetical protein [Pseudolabrys sp.]